jgi:hypothetical protein
MSDTSGDVNTLREQASAALDRAHLAAAAANGAELRRALEAAADALDAAAAQAAGLSDSAAKVRAALTDLDRGALVELELLLEQARRSVAGA